jgi:nucleoside-diphosphate-sugar epimerase
MRVLVLGGTVYLSRAIAELARDRGHEVTCAARGTSPAPTGTRFVRIERDAEDGLEPLAGESFDAVIDVARRPSHVRRALRALAAQAGHWTFVSTLSVYADKATLHQDESAPRLDPLPPDADDSDMTKYGEAKVACEDLVTEAFGDRAFTIRAGLIGGPGDPNNRFGYWPLRIWRGGEVLAPGSPDDLVQVIDVADLAGWIVAGAEKGLAGTYNATGPVMPRGEFLTRIAEAVGADCEFTWVDGDFLVAHGVEEWMGPRSLPMWLTPEWGAVMAHDVSAAFVAGLTVRDLAETARTTLNWERGRVEAGSHTMAAGLTAEEEAEVLQAWHARPDRRPTPGHA